MIKQFVFLVGMALAVPALAQTNALDIPTGITAIHIPLQQMVEVSPDRLKARLRLERRGDSPARLQQDINALMTKAVAGLKKHSNLRVETGFYHSYQLRENNFTFWMASQELILDSADAALLLEKVGELQNDFVMSGLDYYLSPAALQAKEQELRLSAIANVDTQAKAYAAAMGRPSYEIKQVTFQNFGAPMLMKSAEYGRGLSVGAAMQSVPAVAESGTVTVNVAGEAIVLIKP